MNKINRERGNYFLAEYANLLTVISTIPFCTAIYMEYCLRCHDDMATNVACMNHPRDTMNKCMTDAHSSFFTAIVFINRVGKKRGELKG
jgi:hypothetical protein